jgi:hypothetical protein
VSVTSATNKKQEKATSEGITNEALAVTLEENEKICTCYHIVMILSRVNINQKDMYHTN